MEAPNNLQWDILEGKLIYQERYTVALYDPNEEGSHRYKTGWWGGNTLQEAQEKALSEYNRLVKKWGKNY